MEIDIAETFQPDSTPAPIRIANRVGAMAERIGLGVKLDPSRLLAAIQRKTALGDFGDPSFLEPLSVLTKSINSNNSIPFAGRVMLKQMIVTALKNRLQIEVAKQDMPESSEQQIRAPLFIVGYPRTGTTLLHNLLANDEQNRTIKMFEALHPASAMRQGADTRLTEAQRFLKLLNRISPAMSKIHSLSADGPDECLKLIENTFVSPHFLLYCHLPEYWTWLCGQNVGRIEQVYRYHRTQLQILGMQRPQQRWVLKAPIHLFFLEGLLRVYPDARIAYLHRNPLDAIPSFCSLTAVSRAISGAKVEPNIIGSFALELYRLSKERAESARMKLASDQILDISYDDLIADPAAAVTKIYGHFGYERPGPFMNRLAAWSANNPQNKHGQHHYSAATFGLSQDRLEPCEAAKHA